MKKIIIIQIFLALFVLTAKSQEKEKKWSLNGYVSNMQSVMFEKIDELWTNDNLTHNRLNFMWYPSDKITATVQVRNRFMYGDRIRLDIDGTYSSSIDHDDGWADMSVNVFSENSFLFNSTIDRLWVQYTVGDFEAKIGRQRINWGQTFVWNPNDIFNTYSFFDFDYDERPGSDAIRLQYYTGMASSVETAIKVNSEEQITAAMLWRFNKWNYDFQFLGGLLNEQDYVIGGGWTGAIKNISFRGEISYLHPKEQFEDTTGLFMATISIDYTFDNSLMLQCEFLYSDIPTTNNTGDFMEFYNGSLSVKDLSFTEYNIFVQASYPINPLLKATISFMSYPKIKGYYVGPSFSYSLKDNLDLSIFVQYFSGEFPDPFTKIVERKNFTLAFLRLKGNF